MAAADPRDPRLLAEVEEDASSARRVPAVARLLRPKQWAKNVLVFAAPFAAGDILEPTVLARTAGGFVAFCLVASGTYCINDAVDAAADREHPVKRSRPVAAGHVPVGAAKALGAVLLLAGLGVAAAIALPLLAVVGCYVALTVAYSAGLKQLPVIDLAAVAGGFILRSVAGGAAAPVPISQWFLIVAGFGSLFIVAGKRHAEHLDLGIGGAAIRSTLGQYSLDYLRFVRAVAAAVCMGGYCLWAFERADISGAPLWYELSIIPFVLAVLYYGLLLERGAGAAPEDIVLGDRTLQVLGVVWLVLFGLGVHGA